MVYLLWVYIVSKWLLVFFLLVFRGKRNGGKGNVETENWSLSYGVAVDWIENQQNMKRKKKKIRETFLVRACVSVCVYVCGRSEWFIIIKQ